MIWKRPNVGPGAVNVRAGQLLLDFDVFRPELTGQGDVRDNGNIAAACSPGGCCGEFPWMAARATWRTARER